MGRRRMWRKVSSVPQINCFKPAGIPLSDILYGSGSLGWTHNHDNQPSDGFQFDPEIYIELSVHFSDLSVRLP